MAPVASIPSVPDQRVFEQAIKGSEAVLPANLLSFLVGPAPVADADFVDAQAALGNLYRDFRFEAKAVFLDGNGLQNLATENFVARFHVGHVHVGEGI